MTVRVRNRLRGSSSGDGGGSSFSPSDLSDLTLWLDASASGTITEVAGSVSQWDDKSGNNYHAIQSTSSNQPQTGTRTLNGLNVIDFPISSDHMNITNAGIRTFPNGNNTCFIVHKTDSTTTEQALLSADQSGGGWAVYLNFDASNAINFVSGGGIAATSYPKDTDEHILAAKRDGTTQNIWMDGGTSVGSGTNGGDRTLTVSPRLGRRTLGGQDFNGYMAEIIIYSQALSASDMNQVGSYLASKWGLTWVNV